MTKQSESKVSFRMICFLGKCYSCKRKRKLAYQLRLGRSITWVCKYCRDYMKNSSSLSKGLEELHHLRANSDNV